MKEPGVNGRLPTRAIRREACIGLVSVLAFHVLASFALAADESTASDAVPTSKADADRQAMLAERDRLAKDANDFSSQAKLSEAIAAGEQSLAIERKIFGDFHEEIVGSLDWLVTRHVRQGDFASARTRQTEVIAICTRLYGENDWRVRTARIKFENLSVHERLSAEQRRLLADADMKIIEALRHAKAGKYREAAVSTDRALETRRKILGDSCLEVADDLELLASLQALLADLKTAERLIQESLEIRRKVYGDDHPLTAESLYSLGRLCLRLEKYEQAEQFSRQALEIRKRVLGEKHVDTVESMGALANCYDNTGDYKQAERFYRQALEMSVSAFGHDHSATAECFNSLGAFYRSMGDYAKAEPLCRGAVEIFRKVSGEEHLSTAISMNTLGELYEIMGDGAKAERLFLRSLEVTEKTAGEAHPNTASCLTNLGLHYEAAGSYRKAEPLLQRALDIHMREYGEQHRGTAQSLNNLGYFYDGRDQPAKAEAYFRRALAIETNVYGNKHPIVASALTNLGTLQFRTREFTKAGPFFEQVLQIDNEIYGEGHAETIDALENLGLFELRIGNVERAETLIRQALEVNQRRTSQTFAVLSERQQLRFQEQQRGALDTYVSLADAAQVSVGSLYEYVLNAKGAVTARQAFSRLQRKRPELAPLFEDLQTVSTQLGTLTFAGNLQDRPARRNQIEELTERKESLERELALKSEEFRTPQNRSQTDLNAMKRSLPAGTALVDVLQYRKYSTPPDNQGPFDRTWRLVAFVVRPDAEAKKVDLGSAGRMTDAVKAWRSVHGTPRESQTLAKLVEMIWKPLEPLLDGVDTILVSPDGPLCRFPFAVLPGSKPGTYLIEDRNIAIVPIPQLLPSLVSAAGDSDSEINTSESLLLVGDVDYGDSPGREAGVGSNSSPAPSSGQRALRFGKLENTRVEIAAIRDSFKMRFPQRAEQVLRGASATESSFRRHAANSRWIHVATHGFFAPRELTSPDDSSEQASFFSRLLGRSKPEPQSSSDLLSGIALAGANRALQPSEDDGILTALEVEALDFSRVDLAVLSACETGLGETAGGEGLLGLQRAFQVAGAKTCLTSLWSVDDAATQTLMTEFYKNLWEKKLSKMESLRQAQLTMLKRYDPKEKKLRGLDLPADKSADSKRGSPFYWAGFVLSGDWR